MITRLCLFLHMVSILQRLLFNFSVLQTHQYHVTLIDAGCNGDNIVQYRPKKDLEYWNQTNLQKEKIIISFLFCFNWWYIVFLSRESKKRRKFAPACFLLHRLKPFQKTVTRRWKQLRKTVTHRWKQLRKTVTHRENATIRRSHTCFKKSFPSWIRTFWSWGHVSILFILDGIWQIFLVFLPIWIRAFCIWGHVSTYPRWYLADFSLFFFCKFGQGHSALGATYCK